MHPTIPDLQLSVQPGAARRYGKPRSSRRRLLPILLGLALIGLLAAGVPVISRARAAAQPVTLDASSSARVKPGPMVRLNSGPTVRPHRTDVVQMGVDGAPAPAPAPPSTTAPAPASTTAAAPAPRASAPAPAAPPAPVAAAAPAGVADSSAEGQVLALVNQERAKAGCGALTADSRLAALARAFSADMRDRGFFAHTNPDGLDPFQRAQQAGITTMRAENIAQGQLDPASVMTAWMNSAGHRANILNCSLRTLGVGVAYGSGGPWWTQDFGV